MQTPPTRSEVPLDRLDGLRQNFRADFTAGFIVFLIALPLCLGIALASGVPPMAGIIAAVIGGLVVSQLSGSFVTINGPAAGLIVVILGAVESLGQGDALLGYRAMLAAVVISGVLLWGLGMLKAGKFAGFFPATVVHGMLAAIGIIIISKQVHVALGVKALAKEPLGLLAEIPASLGRLNPEIAIIGGVSLAILIGWSLIRNRYLKMIPAPMVVVLLGIGLGHLFDLAHEHKYLLLSDHVYDIGPKFLVTLPSNVLDGIVLPSFGQIGTGAFWAAVISITLVQGIETLLSASAVDRLDPFHRKTNMNRDLAAVGAGSALSGLIGGLPIIAEIVRSSANVSSGGRTRWANFFHGGFMLLFVVFLPQLIHQIPLAALAAILIFTGFRLASPQAFRKAFQIGPEQLAIFLVTLFVTLASDLLLGVAAGIGSKLVLHVIRGVRLRDIFRPDLRVHSDGTITTVAIHSSAVFANYLAIKTVLEGVPLHEGVRLDFSHAYLVDHTVLEHLHDHERDFHTHGRSFEIANLAEHLPASRHPMASRKLPRPKSAPNS
jgi:MFS superfamily sulfate permease-like transporter